MKDHEASRTLVKSPPELWAECSDATSLARHLDQFGEIRITRLDPESTVAWEGERASGTVRLEPSGWGTKVILTARCSSDPAGIDPEPPPVAVEPAEPEPPTPPVDPGPPALIVDPDGPASAVPTTSPSRRGFFGRLAGILERKNDSVPAPGESAPARPPGAPEVAPAAADGPPEVLEQAPERPREPEPPKQTEAEKFLAAALESLGQAHHRPFSRS